MKKFLVLIIMVLLLFSVTQAQKNNIGWSSSLPDTLAGADSLYFTSPAKIPKYSGVVGFNYTFTNIDDSLNNAVMQGSMDNSNWSVVTTDAKPSTQGVLLDVNPAYLYYRLFTSTAAGDSVNITSVNFIYKEE